MTNEHDSVLADATSLLGNGEVWGLDVPYHLFANTEEQYEPVRMVGDRMFSKECTRKSGRSLEIGGESKDTSSREVRTFILAKKAGNAAGVKGGRKAESDSSRISQIIQQNCHRLEHWRPKGLQILKMKKIADSIRKEKKGLGPKRPHYSKSVSPRRSKLLTGEPCAGELHARFGGRGGANQCAIPTPIRFTRLNNAQIKPINSEHHPSVI